MLPFNLPSIGAIIKAAKSIYFWEGMVVGAITSFTLTSAYIDLQNKNDNAVEAYKAKIENLESQLQQAMQENSNANANRSRPAPKDSVAEPQPTIGDDNQMIGNSNLGVIVGRNAQTGPINIVSGENNEITLSINNLKALLKNECGRHIERTRRLVASRLTGRDYNAYALPEFSDMIRQQVLISPTLSQIDDPVTLNILQMIGELDYKHTFLLKRTDGSLYAHAIHPYMFKLHEVCAWVGVDLGYKDEFDE